MEINDDQGHGEKIGGQDAEKKKEGQGTFKENINKKEDERGVSTEENIINEDDNHLGGANVRASHPHGGGATTEQDSHPLGQTLGQSSFPLGGLAGTTRNSSFPLGGITGEANFPLGGSRSNFSMDPPVRNVYELGGISVSGDMQGDNITIGPQIQDNSLHQHLHQDVQQVHQEIHQHQTLHHQVHQHFHIGGEHNLGEVGGGLGYSGASSTRAGHLSKQNVDTDKIIGDIDTSHLSEAIGKSALNIMLEAIKEDYFAMKLLSKFSQKLQVQEDFIKAQQKNLGKLESLLTLLKGCVGKPNFSMQIILKAADNVSGLEKMSCELRYNEQLIEKAAYQLCDSDNMEEITILLMESFKISLPLVNKNEHEDEIAKTKRKMKADVKNLLYTFPSTTKILNHVTNVCREKKLFKDAEFLSNLVKQTEREKEEWLANKLFVKKLRQTNTILQLNKIKREENPFKITLNSKLFKATSSIYPGQTLAVKELSYDQGRMTTILKEIQVNKGLQHPNILSIYGCAIQETKRVVWLVMPFIVGLTLQDLLRERNLSRFEKTNISNSIALALNFLHAHQKGIIHGDVKLSNIMIRENTSEAILLDFGISTYTNLTSTATQAVNTTLYGTTEYLAPELLLGHAREATAASDIWSAGCVISQIFAPSSEPLWKVDPNSDKKQQIRILMEEGQCPSIYHTVDLSIKHIVRKCFAMNPSERLSSSKLHEKLEGILRSLPSTDDATLHQSTTTEDEISNTSSSESEFDVQIITANPSSKDNIIQSQNQHLTTRDDPKLSSKDSIQRSRRTNINETSIKHKCSKKSIAAGSCMLTLTIIAVITGVSLTAQNKAQVQRKAKLPESYFTDGACYAIESLQHNSSYSSENNTVFDCRSNCSQHNFSFASVEDGHACICHNTPHHVTKWRSQDFCNVTCAGNKPWNYGQTCGGRGFRNVYDTFEDSGCYIGTENQTKTLILRKKFHPYSSAKNIH